MALTLFRQEVVEAKRDRLMGTVFAAVPPRSQLYASLLLGAALVLVAVVIFGQFASRVAVQGVVAYDRGLARIYPPAVAEVREIHVHEGQLVQAGQPLVTISLSQGRDAEGDGVASQLAQIQRRDGEYALQQGLASSQGAADTLRLEGQAASIRATVSSLERQRSIASLQIRIAEADADRATRLARAKAGSQKQAEDAAAAVLSRRLENESLGEKIIAQTEAVRAVEAQIEQRRLAVQQNVSQIGAQRADLAAQRSALLRLDRLVLTAPVDGRVSDLLSEIGQRTRPETSLVTVVPDGSVLEARLYTPTRAVGFVKTGQEVRLLFDAYPFQKYGAGRGTVTEVSRVPTDPTAIDSGVKSDQPVFRVRIRIDRSVVVDHAETRTLRPGMTLSANLVLESWPLWQVLLSPILKALRA